MEVGFEQPCRAAKLSPVAVTASSGAAALREGWRAGLRAPAPGLQRSLCRTPIPEQAVLTMPAASGLLVLRGRETSCPSDYEWSSQDACEARLGQTEADRLPGKGAWLPAPGWMVA